MLGASQKEQDGRAVKEMVNMEGWQIIRRRMNERVAQAVEDLRNIEVEGRNLSDVGSDCVALIKLIEGIKVVEEEVQTYIDDYHESVNQ